MSNKFAFVIVDESGKAKKDDRLLIRSQCMQGKNRREGSRRALKRARAMRAAEEASIPTQTQPLSGNESAYSSAGSSPRRSTDAELFTASGERVNEHAHMHVALYSSRVPPPPPLDTALLRIPADVDGECQNSIRHHVTFSLLMHNALPIYSCLDFDEFEQQRNNWFFSDVAFFQTTLLATSAYHDASLDGALSNQTLSRLRRTLSLLNAKLSDDRSALLPSTIFIIVILTSIAASVGDYDAVAAHLAGLRQILCLPAASATPLALNKLRLKIDQLGLQWQLRTGQRPDGFAFFLDSWDSTFTYPTHVRSPHQQVSLSGVTHPKLAVIFHDLQYASVLLNEAKETKTRLIGDKFHHIMHSVQARLMNLDDVLDTRADEYLRLVLLAFLTTTFQVVVPGTRTRYKYLENELLFFSTALQSSNYFPVEVRLWLLIVSAATSLNGQEEKLGDLWKATAREDLTWPELRQDLQKVMWINCVHDIPGKLAFDTLCKIANETRVETRGRSP
ncbi:hypothetical protein EJ04DRAFT_580101 [Polyplosphaeria fusca]|uniref:Uncharacterized protein n=1 Tax=Polyplosphaeria fusca TaxID=682080 RepID=A0A9P4QS66_9PLEO|nr:hypothetical protein EJ04DRAFT_580101 [Polyplosphaeria fusca]